MTTCYYHYKVVQYRALLHMLQKIPTAVLATNLNVLLATYKLLYFLLGRPEPEFKERKKKNNLNHVFSVGKSAVATFVCFNMIITNTNTKHFS